MFQAITGFINSFRPPTIIGKLIEGGTKAHVITRNATRHQATVLMYMMIKQVAGELGMEQRQFMNGLIGIDKGVVRERKKEEKQARYGLKK